MNLTYQLLTEVTGRMQADLLESYLEANDIDVELFQESIGHTVYPVNVDLLGYVQVYVPKEKIDEALSLLQAFETRQDSV